MSILTLEHSVDLAEIGDCQRKAREGKMLTGHDIIYFSPGTWDGLWRNRQQLMSIFARKNRVLFVEQRRHLRPTLAGFRRQALGPSDIRRTPIREIAENLFIFSYPVWAPISGRFPLKQLARTVRKRSINTTLDKLNISKPIVWLSMPGMLDLLREIPTPRLLVYHVVDEYTAYSGQTPTGRFRNKELEKKMMAHADLVIVVSKKLYEAKQTFNANTHLVSNAVNYEVYSAAMADPHLPEDLRVIRPPRLGYSGLIGDKLNLNMLKEMAEKNSEWSLMFLGQARFSHQTETWKALTALPNVYHLGPVEVSQVPHYVKGFQVGLMPYLQNRQSDNISPLKLYDYLAIGLPIASMDIPAAREFSQHIHLANSPPDFSRAVRLALTDTTEERCQARRKIAAQHTWDSKVEQLSELIQIQIEAKYKRRVA